MFDRIELGIEVFEGLLAIDEAIVERAAREPCRECGGPLHRGDHPRKPRGGLLAIAGEAFSRRFNLCCGRDGCRLRAMRPSVRFLGRRVYLGAVVIVAAAVALVAATAAAATRSTGVPARTARRWLRGRCARELKSLPPNTSAPLPHATPAVRPRRPRNPGYEHNQCRTEPRAH